MATSCPEVARACFAAVGFDLGETLVDYEGVPLDWEREYRAALAAFAASLGARLTARQQTACVAVLRSFNSRVTPRSVEVDGATVFGALLAAAGLEVEPLSASFDGAVDAFFSIFRGHARAVTGGRDVVGALLGLGVRVGVLTDVPYGMPRRLVVDDLRLAGLDGLAAVTITSVEAGYRKPAPQGFELLAATLGVPRAHMLYVGNERKDVEGANAAGISSVLLWRGPGPSPDWGQRFTIADLADLMAGSARKAAPATRAPRRDRRSSGSPASRDHGC
jgi:putative hydrolase of the HAD superfamily